MKAEDEDNRGSKQAVFQNCDRNKQWRLQNTEASQAEYLLSLVGDFLFLAQFYYC